MVPLSSYRQIRETKSLAETLQLALKEIESLADEMDDLCDEISGQFPGRCRFMPKHQQALDASETLLRAESILLDQVGGLDGILEDLRREVKAMPVTVTVGGQTRRRAYSWRVRCGNAVVRLEGVIEALPEAQDVPDGIVVTLRQAADLLKGVTFPKAYGP